MIDKNNIGKCLIFGECIYNEYEYTFYLNEELVKADECASNLFGRSYCKLNGVLYNNVAYETKMVGQYVKKTDFCLFSPFGLIPIMFVIIFLIFALFEYYLRR